MYKTNAMIHSLKAQDVVTILHEKNNNDVIAEYKGKRCTAIYNPFVGLFYVDDIYGILHDEHKCPNCGDHLE